MKNKIIAVLTAISIALSMFCYLPASAYADGEENYGTDMYFRLLTGIRRNLIWDNTFIPESSKSPCLNDFMNDLHAHLQSGGIGSTRNFFEIEISGDVYVNKSIDLSEFVDNYQLETLIIASRVGPHKKDAVIHNNVPDKAPMFIVNKQALQVVFVNIQISGDNIPETTNILSDGNSIIQYVDKNDAESISEEDGSASDYGIFDTESENNSSDETVSDEGASVAESEGDSSVEETSDEDIDAAEKEDSSENMVLGEDEENEDLNADAIEPTEDGSSSSGVMSDGDYFESSTLFTASTDKTNEDVKGNPLITVSNGASVRFTNKSIQYSEYVIKEEPNTGIDEYFPVNGNVQLQNQYGSGVYVGENGTLYMDMQTQITNCLDYGVYVDHNGTFEMRGDTEFHSIPSGSYDDYFGLDLNSNDSTNPSQITGAQISECKHGGVFVADGGTFTMESNSTIKNCGKYDGNDGKLKFGGVYIKDGGKFNMQGNMRTKFLTDDQTNSTENIFINSDRYQKGSPAASGLSANITDNSAIEGGGIYIESGSVTGGPGADDNIKITGGKITNNKAENATTDPTRITKGGGIYVEGGTISIGDADSTKANVEITGNIAQQGGGIYTKGNVELKAGVSVSQNGTKENEIANEGGGVYIGNGGTLNVSNGGSVSTNTANDGGGVYVGEGGIFNVSDGGSISTNQAKNGGGVYVGSGGEFNLPNPDSTGTQSGSVSNNNAAENGGGIYVGEGGTFTLSEGGSIIENKATGNGGGVYVGTDSNGSTGGTGSTGGIFNLNGGVIGVKPAEGEAPESGGANTAAHGGGVYYNDGTFNLSGSPVVSGNSPTNVVLFRDVAHQYPKINITGEVETNDFSNVYIGYSDSEKGIFTNDWKTYNKAENNTDAAIPSPFFWSDDPRYMVALNSGANEDGKDIPAQTEAELVDGFHIHSPCGHYCTKVLDPNLTDADGKKITLIGSDGKVNWEAFDKISGYDFLCAQDHETDAAHKTHKTCDSGNDTDVFDYESVSDTADFTKKFNDALNSDKKNEITLYLLNDITLPGTFETNKDLYICLNGHTLTISGGITLTDSANFALDDCYYDDCYTQHETKKNEGKGKVITSSGTFVTNNGSGTVTLYSGTIEGGTAVSLNSNDGNLFVEDAILVDSNIKATDTTTATITIHRRSAYKGTTDESGVTLNDKTMSGGEINAPGCTVNIIGKSDLNTAVSAASVNGSDINITYGDVTVDGSMKAGNNLNINGSKVTGEALIEAVNDLTVKDSDVNVNTKLGGNKTTTITDSNINNEFGSGSSAIGGQTVNIGNSTVTVFTVSGTNTVTITTNSNVTGDVSSPQVTVDGSSTITGDVTVNGDSNADSIDGQFISGTINGHLMLQGDSGTEIGTFTVTAGEGEVDAALNKGETDKKAKLYLYGSPAIGSIECKSYEAYTDTQLFGKADGKAQLAVTTPITLIVDPRKEGNFVMQEVEKNQENSFILQKASEITPTGEYTQYDAYYMGLEHIAESSSLQIAFALFIGTDEQMSPKPENIKEFTPFIDSNFRAYLRSRFLTDKKYLYKKDIVTICGSEEGINLSTTNNGGSWDVTDLSGIRFFGTDPDHSYSGTLKTLVISNNTIIQPDELWSEELKRLQGTLTTFKCSNCGFNDLNVSDFTKLEVLDCSKNGISTLSLDKNTALTELNCSENKLNALDVSNANNLSILNCSANNITSIESIKNKTALTELYCAENYLHDELDLTSNTGLVKINCSSQKGDQKNNGRITVLKLDGLNNLKEVCCNNNNITYLKFENPSILEKVEASGNTYSIGTSCSEYNPQTSPNEGFDPAKVENPVGAEFAEAAFNNYDYQKHNGSITYNYNIGTTVGGRIANQLIEFKLTYSHTEGDHTDPSPATCTEDEKISGYKCSVCKENFLEHNVDSVVLNGWQDPDNLHPALGHKWVYIEGANPTCEEGHNGHRGYYICQHDISDYDGVHAIPCSKAWGTRTPNADGTVTYTPTEVWFVGVDTANQKVELNLESDALKYLPKNGTISGDTLVDHKLYVESTHKDDEVPYLDSAALFLSWEKVAHKFKDSASYHDEKLPECITPGNIAYYECDVCHKPFNKDVDRRESSGIIDETLRNSQNAKEISETYENSSYVSDKDSNTYQQLGYHLKAYGHNFENAPKYGLKQNGEHHNLDQADCVTTGTWEYWYCGNCGKYFIRRENTPHYDIDRKDGEDGIGSKSDYPGKFIDSSDPNDFTKTEIATVKAPDLVSPFAGDDDHKFAVHTNEELTVNAPADLTEPINKFRHKEFNGEAQPHHVDALNDTICDEHGIKEYLACASCHSIVTMMNEAEHRADPIIEKNVYDLFINPNDTYTGHTSAPVNLSNDTDGGVLKKINANKPPISFDAYLRSLVDGSDERIVIEALKANSLWREAGQHTPPDYGGWIAEPDDPLHDYYICTKCTKDIHYKTDGVNEADFRHDRGSNAYDYTYTDGTEDPENYHHYYCQKCKDERSSDSAPLHTVKYEEKMTPETVSALHLECVNFNDKRELIPGDNENHYKICSDCKRPIKEEHNWNEDFKDDPVSNVHFKTCRDCGYRLEESHTYNPDEFLWDNDNHYHLCTICGHRDKISDHVYDYRYVDNNSHERYCTVDGCEYKEPPTSHDEKPENGSDLWTNADEADPSDAEHKNMHYYFCNTCNHNVYEEHRGRLLDMQSDPEGHWIQCEVCNGNPVRQPHHGTEVVQRNDDDRLIYHDIVCDYKDEETGKECGYHGPAYHNWKEVAQKDPTCTEDGTEHYYFCEDCGIMARSVDTVTTADNKTYLKGVNEIGSLDEIRIEALHHLWYGSSEWKYSGDYTIHYQECERCHKIIDPADPYFDPAHYHKCDLELVGNTSPDGSHRHYFKCRKCDFALDASPETSVNWSPGEETVDGELRTYHYHKCIGTTVPENYKALEGQIKNIACEFEAGKELHVPSGLSENLISLDDECHRDVCAICGLPFRIKHTYVSTDPDGVHEWGYKNPNVHTQRCTVCRHVKEEAHDIFANAEITDEEHIGECEKCGKQISGRHGEWIYEPINETSHKLTCGICHKYSTIEEHSKDGAHNIIWVPCENDPTMHHKVCALCGYDFGERRPHSSFEWKYDDIRDPDTHYLVCKDCGAEIEYPVTNYDGKGHDFNPDEIHLHSFLSYDSDGKLINDKTQAMCSDCHKRNEEYKSPNHGGGDDPRPPQPPFNWDDSSDSSEDSSSSDNSGGSDNSDNSGNSGNSDNSGNSGNSGDSGSSDNSGNSNNSGDPNSSGNDTSNPDDNTKDGIGVDTSDFDDLIITDSEIDRTNTNGAHGNIYKVVRCGRDAPWTYLDTSLEELIDILATDRDLAAVKDEATDMEFLLTVRNADRTVSIDDRRITEKLAAQTDERIGQYLDIDLYKLLGRDRWQLHETERNLRIRFEVPERLQRLSPNREYTVLRIHEGIPTFLDDLDRNPNTITIDTDRFSTYVILYNSHGDSSGLINNENPYTGVRNITIVPTVLAALTVFKTCKRVDE